MTVEKVCYKYTDQNNSDGIYWKIHILTWAFNLIYRFISVAISIVAGKTMIYGYIF